MATKKIENWLSHIFSSGGYVGEDYKAFQKDMHADLRRQAKEAGYTLHKFKPGHYEFSAVLYDPVTARFVYVAITDVRFNQSWYYQTLFRLMAHETDWRGGMNHTCQWPELVMALRALRNQRV